ncbi:hypothetical protein NMY22_g6000 [Coprinellus aureogranulatus]|nr:hypothetical protein NMY22_g6000 [Coprinellus aureogranulatus]
MSLGPALDFILDQTKQNIHFLVEHGLLGKEEGDVILTKLESSTAVSKSTGQFTSVNLSDAKDCVHSFTPKDAQTEGQAPPSYSEDTPDCAAPLPEAPSSVPLFKVKALWNYDEDRKDEKDLSFRVGDIIEIVQETNADWWVGRVHGREGLVPSAYVEKLPVPPPRPSGSRFHPTALNPSSLSPGGASPAFPIPRGTPYSGESPYPPSTTFYSPTRGYPPALYSGYEPQQPFYGSSDASAPPNQPASQAKKPKYGSLGNTLTHSAAGGVGFGAGSTIGSGIIHSIF